MDEPTAVELIAQASTDVREQTEPMRTRDEAQRLVDEVVRLIGESPIEIRVIDRAQADELGHQSPDWKRDRVAGEAFSIQCARVIYVIDTGQKPLIWTLLLFHEMTHVLLPASDPPHGPQFVRGWLDLMHRFSFYEIAAHSIESALRLYNVPIDNTPSRLASSNLGA